MSNLDLEKYASEALSCLNMRALTKEAVLSSMKNYLVSKQQDSLKKFDKYKTPGQDILLPDEEDYVTYAPKHPKNKGMTAQAALTKYRRAYGDDEARYQLWREAWDVKQGYV